MSFQVNVSIPIQPLASLDVNYVQLPSAEGSMGVLQNHAPLRCTLVPGVVLCRLPDQSVRVFSISGGVAMVRNNVVTILADIAEDAHAIDSHRAEAARERALQRLREGSPEINRARAEAALHRSLARIQARFLVDRK
jgi:F-type H+-transporting ATPase subunit epsilon